MAPINTPFSPALNIRLLGRFQVSVRGRTLPEGAIQGRKARSLLKLIALQRHWRIVRDQAMETLWPDLDAEAAASQLYKALHHVRKALSAEADEASNWIEITDELVRLDPGGDLEVDVHRFEETARAGLRNDRTPKLETAVSLYAGDLLPMDLYAEWTSLPREHYRQLYLDVLTALATRYEQRGSFSEAAQMLRLAIEKDPALEAAHRGLMRIFARRGQPTRAFRQYDFCREVLRSELGTSPSPRTRAVLDSVREERRANRAGAGGVATGTPGPTPPIVGRVSELTTVEDLLDRLATGAGSTLLVRGRTGTGKTRLVDEVVVRARHRGFRVYSCGADEDTGTGAYHPFVELFDEILRDHPDLVELLPEALGRLVPRFSGDGAPVPHADGRAARGYIFAQVQRFIARLTEEGPLLLTIDDLHAADEETRMLFAYLSLHGDDLPLLLVGTTQEEASDLLVQERSESREERVSVLDLSPLETEAHATLLRQRASEPVSEGLIERIFELSEGNPLFALELLRAREAEGIGTYPEDDVENESDGVHSSLEIPPSLRSTTERELEELSPPARRLLYPAAVLGRHVSYELLAALWRETAASGKAEIFEPLEELLEAELLEEEGLDYSFRHTLLRETVYAMISEPRRRALHAAIARQLVSRAQDSKEGPVEDIAHHYLRAGEPRQAVHYLIQAGERAESVYAHDHTLELYREAISALEAAERGVTQRLRRDLLERIGDVYRACGRLERSYDAYEEAAELAREIPMTERDLVDLHRKIAVVATFRTEMDRAKKHLDRAFEHVGEDERARTRLLVTRALRLWHLNRLEEAYEVAREALDRAEVIDASAEASQACEILAMTCLPLGRWEEGLEYEMRREIHGWSPEIVVATDAHLCLWEYHLTGDQPFERARSFIEQVAEQASDLGDMRCVAVCHYALGTMYVWRGENRRAAEELDRSLELHERVGSPAGKAYVLARKGILHTMRGATELGWQAIREGITEAERAAVRDHCLQRLYGVGIWNRLEAGDSVRVRELVELSQELLEEEGACGACSLELFPWLAFVHLRSDEAARARECGEAIEALAEKTGNPVGQAIAAMIESSVRAAEQETDRAQELRERAFALAEETVEDASHSPVVHYLDRMSAHQEELAQPSP